jgi:putative phage-type endonuclease
MNKVNIIPVWDKTVEEWEQIRGSLPGIGGSDAGTVVGVNKYKSPYALWGEKTGIIPSNFEGNEATKWGHRLERIIAEAYAEDYNVAVVSWPVILVSEENPFMFANLDFVIVEPSQEFPAGVVTDWKNAKEPAGVKGILEVKTAGIASPGNLGAWSNDGIPQSYMLQGYHYGITTGWTDITFAALVGGSGLQVRKMNWDPTIAENLVIAEQQFWDLVESKTAPETDGSDATESALSARYPRHEAGVGVEGGSKLADLWEQFNNAKEEAERADNERKALRAAILEIVGNAEYATVDGKPILSYKANSDTETLDAKALKEAMPDVYAQFSKTRAGSRVLRGIK